MDSTMSTSVTEPEIKAYESFDDMGLEDDLARGIYAFGFEKPSKIQMYAVVPMKERRDILAQSQSGTGKTGAFTIGSLSCVDKTSPGTSGSSTCPYARTSTADRNCCPSPWSIHGSESAFNNRW